MPIVKYKNSWIKIAWQDALELLHTKFQSIVNTKGPASLAGLISPSVSIEEQYLVQKYLRAFGTNNIDHRLQQLDFRGDLSAPLSPECPVALANIAQQKTIVLLGANVTVAQPILAMCLRKQLQNGGDLAVINPIAWELHCKTSVQEIVDHGDLLTSMLGLVKILAKQQDPKAELLNLTIFKDLHISNNIKKIAQLLLNNGAKLLLLGEYALNNPQASLLYWSATIISKLSSTKLGILTNGANSAGAWLTGCVPHRLPGGYPVNQIGANAYQMLTKPFGGYLLYAVEPELDSIVGNTALDTLRQADFTVVFSNFKTPGLAYAADLLLPIATFAETSGTFVNFNGCWQTFAASLKPAPDIKAGWQVLLELADNAKLLDCNYASFASITAELHNLNKLAQQNFIVPPSSLDYVTTALANAITKDSDLTGLTWIPNMALFANDPVLRRATALQEAVKSKHGKAYLHSKAAAQYNLVDNGIALIGNSAGKQIKLPIVISDIVPPHCILIMQNDPETVKLGQPYQQLSIMAWES